MATPTPAAGSSDRSDKWRLLVDCLTVQSAGQTSRWEEDLQRLRDTGGVVFEAVVGSPFPAYGPRLTFEAGQDAAGQAAALGFGDHPWGPPDWYGVRPGGIKPYHRSDRVPAGVRLPAGLPDGLRPQLAARHDGRTEIYLRRPGAHPWPAFARACAGLLGAGPPDCRPLPRNSEGGHCVSLAFRGAALEAVTLYAEDHCLPDDRSVAAAWSEGLDAADRRAYEAALGGVRAVGRPGLRPVHALLAWTLLADGTVRRAVSLRIRGLGPVDGA